jgi:hypothetical protein
VLFREREAVSCFFCHQPIINNSKYQARFRKTDEENFTCQISMNDSRGAVFAKTFSLNMTALSFATAKNNHD